MSEPLPEFDTQGEFWPDGRPNRFNRPQALTLSGCFKAGAVTCTNCHLAHGSTNHEFSLKVDVRNGRVERRALHPVPSRPGRRRARPATRRRRWSASPAAAPIRSRAASRGRMPIWRAIRSTPPTRRAAAASTAT